MLILLFIVGRRLLAGLPPPPYPQSLNAMQRSRRVQRTWMIPRLPNIVRLKSGGILVDTGLAGSIKESDLV